METKEQMELRRVGRYYTYTGGPSDTYTVYDSAYVNSRPSMHPHYTKIMMLYKLVKGSIDRKTVGRIIDRIQRYGGDYKLKKRDYVLMNKLYKEYK